MDENLTDEIIRRAGMIALLYYPEIAVDDPDWSLARDVGWILQPATDAGIPVGDLREVIARVILDPTGSRNALAGLLLPLATAL